MTRKEEVERIILGTLLNNRNVLSECTGSITLDMFSNDDNKRIYAKIVEYSNYIFSDITPASIIDYDNSMIDLAQYMCELASDYDFETKKLRYNTNLYYYSKEQYPNYTTVEFSDYVTRFVQLYVESIAN